MVSGTSIGPKEAGELVGRSKSAILKAIREGRISAQKTASGEWKIEPVELFRVYPAGTQSPATSTPQVSSAPHPSAHELQAEVEHLRELLRRSDQRAEEWKAKAEQEAEERRALTRMLTDQRTPTQKKGRRWGIFSTSPEEES